MQHDDSEEVERHESIDTTSSFDYEPQNTQDEPARSSGKNGEIQHEVAPTLSRTVSGRSIVPPVKRVPRSSMAGLLGRFSILYEAEEPKHYPRSVKWWITFVIALAAVAAPMGSSIILPALNEISNTFGSDHFITNFSVAFYMLSMSLFPLWWSSFSETAGRRAVYIVSFALFILWNVLAAISSNVAMFIVMRVLSGGSSAAVQAVGAGTIADIWEVKERGRAMGIFYLGPLCGPLIAPVIGGGLTEGLGWRSTQWFQVIYGAVVLLLVILFLPETHKTSAILAAAEQEAVESTIDTETDAYTSPEQQEIDIEKEAHAEANSPNPTTPTPPQTPPTPTRPKPPSRAVSRVSSKRSATTTTTILRTRRLLALLRRIFIDPLKIILYLRFPAVALTVYYASVAFGSLYFLNISVQKTFSAPPYNFNDIVVGCLYIFNSTGYLITSIFGGYWVDRIMHRSAVAAGRIDPHTRKPIYHPLDRFKENVYLAAVAMPASLVWYGWSADKGVYWLCPMIANFCFGAGSMLIFGAATTMLTEMMPRQSSNGVALNNFVRNVFSFAGTFLAEPLINAIGNGPLFSIIGGIALASSGVIALMRRNGERWRERMERELGS